MGWFWDSFFSSDNRSERKINFDNLVNIATQAGENALKDGIKEKEIARIAITAILVNIYGPEEINSDEQIINKLKNLKIDLRRTIIDALRKAIDSYNIGGKMSMRSRERLYSTFKRYKYLEIEKKKFDQNKYINKDHYMVTTLTALCKAYENNQIIMIEQLEPTATKIGKELNEKGGIEEMRRVWNLLGNIKGSRTLDMHWNGIGEWRG